MVFNVVIVTKLARALLVYLPCLLICSDALFADEAGTVDYTITTAGHGRLGVRYTQLIANGTAVLTSSSISNALPPLRNDGGCFLSSRALYTGEVLWRRDVCGSEFANYAVCSRARSESLIYTLDSRGVLRGWNEVDGHLVVDRILNGNPTGDMSDMIPRFIGCDENSETVGVVLSNARSSDVLSFLESDSNLSPVEAEKILNGAKVTADESAIPRIIGLLSVSDSTDKNTLIIVVAAYVHSSNDLYEDYVFLDEMAYLTVPLSTASYNYNESILFRYDRSSSRGSLPLLASSVTLFQNKDNQLLATALSADYMNIVLFTSDNHSVRVISATTLNPSWRYLSSYELLVDSSIVRISGSDVLSPYASLTSGHWTLPDLERSKMMGTKIDEANVLDGLVLCNKTVISFQHSRNSSSYSHTIIVQVQSDPQHSTVQDQILIPNGPIKDVHILECEPKALILLATKSGGTMILSSSFSGEREEQAKLRMLWASEESMASISSGLFLDMSQSAAKHLDIGDESEESVVSSLTASSRLISQWKSFQNFATGGFLDHLQSITKGSLMEKDLSLQHRKDYSFGFSKIAVLLSNSFSKLMGTDTLSSGEVMWSLNLNPAAAYHTLVHGTLTSRSSVFGLGYSQPHSHEILVLSHLPDSVEWSCIDIFRGRILTQSSVKITSSILEVIPFHGHTLDCRQGAILLHEDYTVSVVPSANNSLVEQDGAFSGGVYMLRVNKDTGRVHSLYSSPTVSEDGAIIFGKAILVGETVFDPRSERILSWAFPQKNEIIQAPATIVGDESLLLKYLNPHICVVVTEASVDNINSLEYETQDSREKSFHRSLSSTNHSDKQKKKPLGAGKPGDTLNAFEETGTKNDPPPTLFVNILDTVSGRILYRASHTHADHAFLAKDHRTDVPILISENWIVYAFPNYRSRRTDIGVLTMHEGMIDKHGITAFRAPEQELTFSSLTSPKPIILSKTFGFAKPVTAIGITNTKGGISSRNILLATGIAGQVVRIDRRMLDPRRPMGEPKRSEKEEGLMQYAPIIPLLPQWILSYSNRVHSASSILSSAANLESQTIIIAFGGPDIFFTRLAPSKSFDCLPENFNRLLLLSVLIVLLLALRIAYKRSCSKLFTIGWL